MLKPCECIEGPQVADEVSVVVRDCVVSPSFLFMVFRQTVGGWTVHVALQLQPQYTTKVVCFPL